MKKLTDSQLALLSGITCDKKRKVLLNLFLKAEAVKEDTDKK